MKIIYVKNTCQFSGTQKQLKQNKRETQKVKDTI